MRQPELWKDFLSSRIWQLISSIYDNAKSFFFGFGIPKVVFFNLFWCCVEPVLKKSSDFFFVYLDFLINAELNLFIRWKLLLILPWCCRGFLSKPCWPKQSWQWIFWFCFNAVCSGWLSGKARFFCLCFEETLLTKAGVHSNSQWIP